MKYPFPGQAVAQKLGMGRVSHLSLPATSLHKATATEGHRNKTFKENHQGKEAFQLKREFSKVASYKINTQTLWLAKYPKIVVTKYTGGKKKGPIHDSAREEKFLGGS